MNWDYVAGITDGEGAFTITISLRDYLNRPNIVVPTRHQRNYCSIYNYFRLGMTNHESLVLLELMRDFLVEHEVSALVRPQRDKSNHNRLIVQRQKDLLKFCKKIAPFLHLKKPLAQAMIPILEMLQTKKKGRDKAFFLRIAEIWDEAKKEKYPSNFGYPNLKTKVEEIWKQI